MLYIIVKDNKITGINQIMTKKQLETSIKDLTYYLLEDITGLNYILANYTYDYAMDFLQLSSNESFNLKSFEIFNVIISSLGSKKKFFTGRQPCLSDINLILDKVTYIKTKEVLDENTI